MQSHPAHDAFQRLAAFHLFFIPFASLVGELERQLVGRVVLQHIEDETFLDSLAHRINMECRWQIVRTGGQIGIGTAAEQLQCLGLRRGGERHIGNARIVGACRHLRRQQVFCAHFTAILQLLQLLIGQHRFQIRRRRASL